MRTTQGGNDYLTIHVDPPRAPGEPAADEGSPEQDQDLQQRWRKTDPSEPAATAHIRIGTEIGRSDKAIRSRLAKLGLDPDQPGPVPSGSTGLLAFPSPAVPEHEPADSSAPGTRG